MLKTLPPAEHAAPAASATGVRAKQAHAIPSLDGIRAISMLLVVLGHAGFHIVPSGLGVTVFFFLSGYLITTLMLAEKEKTGGIDIPKFYVRRAFRLLPPLVVTLAIAYGLNLAGVLGGGITAAGVAAQLLYFANYHLLFFPGGTVPDGTTILWSLAVEEHFYIFYPLFMALLPDLLVPAPGSAKKSAEESIRRRSTVGIVLAGVCLAVLGWRIHLVQSPDFVIDRTSFGTDARIDSIVYGCILAVLKNPVLELHRPGAMSPGTTSPVSMSPGQWAILAIAAGTLVFSLVHRDTAFRETARYSLQGLALMPIFYYAVGFSGHPLFRPLNSPWAVRLGVYSYAIYLVHYMVMRLIATHVPALAISPLTMLLPALVISIAYAAALDRFVDPYFRRLRHQYRAASSAKAPPFPTAAGRRSRSMGPERP
jgi:peptidoglycan/LPS O-acetylase OafA/YrhL